VNDAFNQHKQKYGPMWLAGTVILVVSVGGSLATVSATWESLADKAYVNKTMQDHEALSDFRLTELARVQAVKWEAVEETLNSILENQLRAELDRLYARKCEGVQGLDQTIRRLEQDYRKVSGYTYVKPC
jgi:hypothetical protein